MLSEVRSWSRDVGFEKQVKEVMKSIAGDWGRRRASNPVIGEAALYPKDETWDEEAPSLLQEPRSPERSVENRLVAAGVLEEVAKLFADDARALEVVECLRLQLRRGEMCERTGRSEKDLAAAVRRVRRDSARFRFGLVW